jgi:hypothetical protein
MIGIALAAVVAVVCVLFVALPFLREPEPESDRLAGLSPEQERALERLEQRDRALAALRELELDHRTGKISDDDYLEQRVLLRAEAARTLAAADSGPGAANGGHVRELPDGGAERSAVLAGLRDEGRGAGRDPVGRGS